MMWIHSQYVRNCIEKSCKHLVFTHHPHSLTHSQTNKHNAKESETRERERRKQTQENEMRNLHINTKQGVRVLTLDQCAFKANFVAATLHKFRHRIFAEDRICLQMNRFETNIRVKSRHTHTIFSISIIIIIGGHGTEAESKKKKRAVEMAWGEIKRQKECEWERETEKSRDGGTNKRTNGIQTSSQ